MMEAFKNIVDRSASFGQQNAPFRRPCEVELLLGPYRNGKTSQLIDELVEHCTADPFDMALVVVPSARYRKLFEERLYERLKRSTRTRGAKSGLLGLHVLPFYRACDFVLKKAGMPLKLIPEAVRAGVISGVVSALQSEGHIQALDPIIGFAGTHSALLELIDELQRAALLPEEVIAKLEETAQSESRYMELAKIYERYSKELSAMRYYDERGVAFAARSMLSRPEVDLKLGMVAADGFDRFNSLQLHVLAGLSEHAQKTRICFDYVPPEQDPSSEYGWKEASFAELQSVFRNAEHRQIRLDQSIIVVPETKMSRMLDRFFEAQEVARQIKQRIADGASPANFLVVARSISAYSPAIHAAFDGAGVSYFLDEAVELNTLPAVQFIMRLLELSGKRKYKRSEVIACLRSVNFRQAAIFDNERDLKRLDEYSLKDQVVESKEQWFDLVRIRGEKFSKSVAAAFTLFMTDLELPPSGSLRDFVVWTENVLDRYFKLSTDASDDQFLRWEENRALGEFRRSLASLIHEENIVGETVVSGAQFLSRLATLVERTNFRRLPRTKDYVTICGADLAPNRTYDEVFVLGLVEGEFPRRAKQSGFLSTDEIGGWLSYGIDLRNPRYHAGFEPALFRSLLQRATKQVHLSCPTFDAKGEELIASYLLTGGDENPPIENISAFVTSRALPVSARDALSSMLWLRPDTDVDAVRAMLPLTTLAESVVEPLLIAQSRARGSFAPHFNGDLKEHIATGALTQPLPAQWSASRLNEYGKCPFRYWVSQVAHAEPQEEPEAGLDVQTLGRTYHKAMELFYRTLLGRNQTLRTLEWEEASRLFQSAVNAAWLGWGSLLMFGTVSFGTMSATRSSLD